MCVVALPQGVQMQTVFVLALIIGAFVAMGCAILAYHNRNESREFFWAATGWSLWIPAVCMRPELTVSTSASLLLLIFLVISAMWAYHHRRNSLR